MKKTLIITLILIAISLAGVTNSSASGKEADIQIYINYSKMTFEDHEQGPFIDVNNRVQVPLRILSEKLNAKVDWDKNNNIIEIEKNNKKISLEIGNEYYKVNDERSENFKMDTTPQITDKGRTVVPMRFISEMFDKKVEWKAATRAVYIKEGSISTPDDVVKQYWQKLVIDGNLDKADDIIVEGRTEELDYMNIGIDNIDSLDAADEDVMGKYNLEVYDYSIDNNVALVEVKLTKPNFKEGLDKYMEDVLNKIQEMIDEGKDIEKINEEVNEYRINFIKEADTITHEGKVELHFTNGSWKIYDLIFDEMKKRWDEIEQMFSN